MNNISDTTWDKLAQSAAIAYNQAYAPYSNFKVGSAALTSTNTIVKGCNVENASYGLTVCSERNCIAQGVIQHEGNTALSFVAMVIYTEEEKLTPPCGACRQVIAEFFPATAQIRSVNHLNKHKSWQVNELLPDAFLPEDLLTKN